MQLQTPCDSPPMSFTSILYLISMLLAQNLSFWEWDLMLCLGFDLSRHFCMTVTISKRFGFFLKLSDF